MKNILFISGYPYPLNKGSYQHAYFFLKSLAERFNVYCIFFVPPEQRDHFKNGLEPETLGIKAFDICFYREDDTNGNEYYRAFKSLVAFPYLHMKRATHPQGLELINKYIRNYSIDIVHFEHFHYCKYAFLMDRSIKKAVVYHDLYHAVDWQHIRFNKNKIEKYILLPAGALKKYLFQRMLDAKVDLKIFLNSHEMRSLPNRSVHIPHIVNPDIRYRRPRDSESCNILFLGGYNHPPNRISFAYIIKEVLPGLVRRVGNFRLQVVGPNTERFQESLNGSKIRQYVEIRGFVNDINEVFQDADIAFLPIMYGGGIKTKIIEAMAAGVPVVTTPSGLYGMDNLPTRSVGVGWSSDELIEELLALMGDHSLRLARSAAAMEYVRREHSLEELPDKLMRVYGNI